MKTTNVNYIVKDRDPFVVQAFARYFRFENWKILEPGDVFDRDYKGDFLLSADALVSPANCYGNMDGGIDKDYVTILGDVVADNVDHLVKIDYKGKLPIGKAGIVSTGHDLFKWLIVAPTIERPMAIADIRDIYKAASAIFHAIKYWNLTTTTTEKIKSVVIPGLGTGVGNLPPEDSAKAVFYAYEDFIENK